MSDAVKLLDAHEAMKDLRGRKVILPTVDELVDKIAQDMMQQAAEAVDERGVFHLALSGGSTPQVLYKRLMIDPDYRSFPWANTHVWVVDDRCVPFDDEKSNWKMMTELLVEPGDLKSENVHPMLVTEADGDVQYEGELRKHLDNDVHGGMLDFTLLGMGPDGHTASLFPETPGLNERERWVIFNDGERVILPRPRMTMTYPLINRSRLIALLLTGAGKFEMLQKVSANPDDVQELPVTGIRSEGDNSEMVWYLDLAAASGE